MAKTIKKIKYKNRSIKNRIIGGAFPKQLGNDPDKGKILVYVVFGLGCGFSDLDDNKKYLANNIGVDESNMIILCHKTTSAITSIRKTIFKSCPLPDSNFVKEFVKSILDNINKYEKILIYGHSFGGAIVNRVAEELNNVKPFDEQMKNKLFMSAFGSIYIPKKQEKQENINIINYIAKGDVVRKCGNDFGKVIDDWQKNSFEKKINAQGIPIIYKKMENTKIYGIHFCNTNCTNFNDIINSKGFSIKGIFGSTLQWDVHRNYLNLIIELGKKETIDINDIHMHNAITSKRVLTRKDKTVTH